MFPWDLEEETVFIEVSRNDSADVWNARASPCFENLRENGDVAKAKPCACSIKMLTRFPQSLLLETKGSLSRVGECVKLESSFLWKHKLCENQGHWLFYISWWGTRYMLFAFEMDVTTHKTV